MTFRSWANKRVESIIDITLTNLQGQKLLPINDWEVNPKESFSDHKYVNFTLGIELTPRDMVRNWKKMDWSLFQYNTSMTWTKYPVPDDQGSNLDECTSCLEKGIEEALEMTLPKNHQ